MGEWENGRMGEWETKGLRDKETERETGKLNQEIP